MNLNKSLSSTIVLSILIASCSNQVPNVQVPNKHYGFGIKSISRVENGDVGLTYKGTWNNPVTLSGTSGGNYATAVAPPSTVENIDGSLTYTGTWSRLSDGSASGGNYEENNGSPLTLINNDDVSLKYGNGVSSWTEQNTGTSRSWSYNEVPLKVENTNTNGSEFHINTYTTFYQRYSSVAMDRIGDFVIIWTDGGYEYPGCSCFRGNDGHEIGLFGKRYNSNGDIQ